MVKKFMGSAVMFALPMLAFASSPQLTGVEDFIKSIGRLVGILLPLVVAIGLLYFFWGLAQFILASGDEDARKEGRSKMIWGVIALFVMTSVWGLVTFVGDQLDIAQNGDSGTIPTVDSAPGYTP
jgi:uncharacterized membrane protein